MDKAVCDINRKEYSTIKIRSQIPDIPQDTDMCR